MSNDNKISKFWTFISKRLGAKAPLADWRLKLENELDFKKLQKNYLTPTGDMSGLIMCPKQCNPSCGFRKVCEYEGEYEAACRDWPLNSYKIDKTDALIHTVKTSTLLSEIANVFQVRSHIEAFYKEEDTWQLGEVQISGCKPATVYLTLNIWEHEITDLIFRFNCKEQRPYILLVTARKAISQTSDAILKNMGAAFVPLNEVIDFNVDTEFKLIRECNLPQLVMPPAPEPEPEPKNIFRKCGDAWEVRFDGGEKFILTNCNTGATYLHFMLERPNATTPIMEIIRKVSGESESVMSADRLEDGILTKGYSFGELPGSVTDNIADDKAIRQYRQEIIQIKHDIEAAKSVGDNITTEQLELDLQNLTSKINEIISPAGQRKIFGNEVKKLLDAFRGAVNYAIEKISTYEPMLAEHLRNTVRFKPPPGYMPDRTINWDL